MALSKTVGTSEQGEWVVRHDTKILLTQREYEQSIFVINKIRLFTVLPILP